MNTFPVFSILATILSCSCSYSEKDFNLNTFERSFFNAFQKGDTLIYENRLKQLDKIVILGLDSTSKKESGYLMARPAYIEVYVLINGTTDNDDTLQMFCITKNPQEKETIYRIQFKNFSFYSKTGLGEIHKETMINGNKITDYYLLNGDTNDTTSADIETLYWTQKQGLVAYKQKNGTCWIRKND